MLARSLAVLVLGVTLVVAGDAAAQERAQNPDVAAVHRVVEAFAQFTQAKNLAAIDTLFGSSRGVHIIEGAGVNHGWAEYRDTHLKPELDQFQNFQYRFSSVEAQVRAGVVWAAFRYELIADTSSGHVESEGRGTAVLEKQNNRWVIVHLHTSAGGRNPSAGA